MDYGQGGVVPGTTFQVDPSSAFPVAGDSGEAAGTGAGRFGFAPVVGDAAGTVSGGVVGMWNWLNTPFTQAMSPVQVSLLVGVVIVSVLIWNMILYHIRIAGEAL